ncbi:MAG: hypothetical protein DWQ05_10505 [Calditrichaeota bacterium]|nr:MAG: hypothetical protein DWQ05_10505 [Calditrichota bacterium]
MEELKILIFTLLGVIVLAGLSFISWKRKPKKENDAAADYAAGLNYLLEDDVTMALRKLRDTVQKDTTNIDAYIKIGDILRENGNSEQGIKIHRDLTARTTLSEVQRMQVFRSLVADYEKLERLDLALKMISKIWEIKPDDLWAKEKQLQIFENLGQWEDAAGAYKSLAKIKGNLNKAKLATYKINMGKKFAANNKEKDARLAFREAFKIDKQSADAYIGLSDSYMREKRPQDALNTLKKFVQNAPDQASAAFQPIKDLLYQLGEFGEIENIYNQVITQSPENWEAYMHLARLKVKKGHLDQAIDICQNVLQLNPEYAPAREHLIRYYHRSGKDLLAVEQAIALINNRES